MVRPLRKESPSSTVRPAERTRPRLVRVVADYLSLTKPRIVELLLVTTVPTMLLAAHGRPGLGLVAVRCSGAPWRRRRQRPQLLSRPRHRCGDGAHRAPPAASPGGQPARRARLRRHPRRSGDRRAVAHDERPVRGARGRRDRVLRRRLHRRPQAAHPVEHRVGRRRRLHARADRLVGGHDSLAWAPVVLFAVIFFWTPPHFWALAIRFRDDYARAGVPMLPVVATEAVVADRIVVYSWAMVAASLLLWPVAGTTAFYPLAAAVLGGWFLREAHGLRARVLAGVPGRSVRLFRASIHYLSALFCCVAVDALLQLLR